MADAAFRQDHPLSRAVAEPQVIEVSPAVVDVLIALGGAALFALALPKARRMYLTEVEADVPGDVCFPPFDEAGWREVSREAHPAGEGDDHPFVFRVLERV